MASNPTEVDNRIMQIDVEINGKTSSFYSPLYLKATGTKYANQNQNEGEIVIGNLTRDTANYLLTQTSPFNPNKTIKTVTVKAGRASTGLTTVFIGNISSSIISQPPDIFITLRCLTQNSSKGDVVSVTQPPDTTVGSIARGLASSLGLNLNFQASDKTVSNYSFTGGVLNQVNDLQSLGDYDVYIDDNVLVVKDILTPLSGKTIRVDLDHGMIEKPEFTEQGVKVKFMFDGVTTLGSALELTSITNPATSGRYVIYKLGFELATREKPFYWIAEAARITQ